MKRKIESLGIILMAIALIVSCKASADNATGRVTLNINAMVKETEKALEVSGTSASAEEGLRTFYLTQHVNPLTKNFFKVVQDSS